MAQCSKGGRVVQKYCHQINDVLGVRLFVIFLLLLFLREIVDSVKSEI